MPLAPPGLDGEDSALIDSFFLPGGILDPDEDDEQQQQHQQQQQQETTNEVSRFASLHPPAFGRIPSNPWGNDTFLAGSTAPVPSSLLSNFSQQTLEHSTIPPPPGYGCRFESHSFFSSEQDSNSQSPYMHHPVESNDNIRDSAEPENHQSETLPREQQHLHLPSSGPVMGGSPPSIQRRRIGRSNQTRLAPITSAVDGKNAGTLEYQDFSSASGTYEATGHSILRIPPDIITPRVETGNQFMAFIEHDDDSSSSNESRRRSLAANGLSNMETGTEAEDKDFEDYDMEDDHDDDDDQDVDDDSITDESPFPIEYLSFVKTSSSRRESTTSSVSSSSNDSELDNSRRSAGDSIDEEDRYNQGPRDVDEVTLAPNSEVAVVLDVKDDRNVGLGLSTAETVGNGLVGASSKFPSKMMHEAQSPGPLSKTVTSTRNSKTDPSSQTVVPSTCIRERLDALRACLTTILPIVDGQQVEWMLDLVEVLRALTSTVWNLLLQIFRIANKVLTMAGLILFQLWKFALVEAIEEPKVASCYVVFYFMPHCCSLLMQSFILPHWTPHFVISIALWLLSTTIPDGVFHPDTIEVRDIPALIWEPEREINKARTQYDRACKTFLRGLRYLLPVLFFFDGFSAEYGTMLGVSGSGRLTSAYLMSLIRKSLAPSPVGWVSWALQVLVATYHPASFVVELLVLITGLSSIRLIRYMEVQRLVGGNTKKRHRKRH